MLKGTERKDAMETGTVYSFMMVYMTLELTVKWITITAQVDKAKRKRRKGGKLYMEHEVILIRYYNVQFLLKFQIGTDELKKNCLFKMLESSTEIKMKTLYGWCHSHRIPITMKFTYRKDYSFINNLWNLYSYGRFRMEITRQSKK